MTTPCQPPHLLTLPKLGDPSIGYITVAEEKALPFPVRRVYWTYYTPQDVQRGRHAHHALQQILVAAAGSIVIRTEMTTGEEKEFLLDSPRTGLYLPPLCWHTMNFSHNAVLLSLSSEEYSEADYIRDYAAFKTMGNVTG